MYVYICIIYVCIHTCIGIGLVFWMYRYMYIWCFYCLLNANKPAFLRRGQQGSRALDTESWRAYREEGRPNLDRPRRLFIGSLIRDCKWIESGFGSKDSGKSKTRKSKRPGFIHRIVESKSNGIEPGRDRPAAPRAAAWRRPSPGPTVSFHNLKSQNFKLSVSNPKRKYVAYLSVLSQISIRQGLRPQKQTWHFENWP